MNSGEVADFYLDIAYRDGRRAGQSGIAFALNPYHDHSPAAEEWADGWRSAQGERLARYGDRAVLATAILLPFVLSAVL